MGNREHSKQTQSASLFQPRTLETREEKPGAVLSKFIKQALEYHYGQNVDPRELSTQGLLQIELLLKPDHRYLPTDETIAKHVFIDRNLGSLTLVSITMLEPNETDIEVPYDWALRRGALATTQREDEQESYVFGPENSALFARQLGYAAILLAERAYISTVTRLEQ